MAPLLSLASPLSSPLAAPFALPQRFAHALPFADITYQPHYPSPSSLADLLRLVTPGSDAYSLEPHAVVLQRLLIDTFGSPNKLADAIARITTPQLLASSFIPSLTRPLRSRFGLTSTASNYTPPSTMPSTAFARQVATWLGLSQHMRVCECEIFAIQVLSDSPLRLATEVRFDFVLDLADHQSHERVGTWQIDWQRTADNRWLATTWQITQDTLVTGPARGFVDVAPAALQHAPSYRNQLGYGIDHWRTVIDGAAGIDLYSNNGVAVGDYNNDGWDDIYVSQPAGLPNRLYRNRGDGSFDDVTEEAGVGVLDNTSCALFADFDNRGLQDLLVVTGSGPLLYRNNGNGSFTLLKDAFTFARPPQGTFTHAAIADYDGDGRLDIYFCLYMYYLGLDQYHYPVPYYDARNGPPNCLFHNQGNGRFIERTVESGLDADNDRYSFACAWGDATGSGRQDLCVVNDFGKSQLYRNNGDGTFAVVSAQAGVEDVGAGMSAAWCDYDNDGHQDIYIPSMWEPAGQRVSSQPQFHADATPQIRRLYQRHAAGNVLYKNSGNGAFSNVGAQAGVAMGRWSWAADFLDIDHDGHPDLYVTNGYISTDNQDDLASFFWRQVVGNSPEDASTSQSYEHGWNAINELIRSDYSWNGRERNVLFLNNGDGTFSEASGVVGLDCLEDGRSFAVADLDHDGRLEIILRSRTAPQLRILRNQLPDIGNSITVRLRGTHSNRDAIGAAVTILANGIRQTRYLQAGTGFLAQHAKLLHFGLGDATGTLTLEVRWPSGLHQSFPGVAVNHSVFIEEDSSSVASQPFADSAWPHIAEPASSTELVAAGHSSETWLLQPLPAPQFTLPDLVGQPRTLASFAGAPVLLFLTSIRPTNQPDTLAALAATPPDNPPDAIPPVVVLLMDAADHPDTASSAAPSATSSATSDPLAHLPHATAVLRCDAQTAGIYNILYRYLFDRRRDLPMPTALLLDAAGSIVKIYQRPATLHTVAEDARRLPTNDAQRRALALPFPGTLVDATFARNDFTYGVALYQHGYLDAAAAAFKQAVAAHPDNADGYYNLGTLNLARHNPYQARGYLEKALALRPDYPEALNNLGMIAGQQGDAVAARKFFEQALSLRPAYLVALVNLGNLYRRARAFPEAQQVLDRALAIEADNPEVHYALGMLAAQQGNNAEAESHLRRAIALRAGYAEALTNLAVLLAHQNRIDESVASLNQCLTLAPDYEPAYLALAQMDLARGDVSAARLTLQKLLTIHPDSASARSALESLP